MYWQQKVIELPSYPRGFHLITNAINQELAIELRQVNMGLLNLFLQHTSASLTINENADPDVRRDLEIAVNHIAPENLAYTHTAEGPDDMPAHIKSSLLGQHLNIPITNAKLNLGTWQGIYLGEHRDYGNRRSIVATLYGKE